MPEQLLLNIRLPNYADFASFIVGENLEAVNFLQHDFFRRKNSFVYLWGSRGSGKSHLLQATSQSFSKISKGSAFYLDFSELQQLKPDVLQGLENYQLVCLDNLDKLSGKFSWQESLFYFFNRSRDKQQCLLISANVAPKDLDFKLLDLKSRMSWGLTLQLKSLSDKDKLALLKIHAKNKGIPLAEEVCEYIINHFDRDTHQLVALLDTIDEQSLRQKRRITIPFLRQFKS